MAICPSYCRPVDGSSINTLVAFFSTYLVLSCGKVLTLVLAMSSLAGADIYHGAWVDWSRGAILGSTVTLSSRYASILTAFLALFVTVVGSCLWRISSFVIHQYSSSPDAKDGLHHQHQLIFRNTGSPAEAAKSFTEIAWHWRRSSLKAWARSLPLLFSPSSSLSPLVPRPS